MSKDEPEFRALKTATTKSITGRSTITYQIGCSPNDNAHIRISKNSGNGFFNNSWYSIDAILKALAKGRKGDPLTSYLLDPLIKGSANTAPFVMAALTQEKLLRVLKGKKRGHEFLDPEGFDARMNKLVSSGVKPKASTKKSPVKKRSVARRKQQ
jgi:hypothetical protein